MVQASEGPQKYLFCNESNGKKKNNQHETIVKSLMYFKSLHVVPTPSIQSF